MTDLFISTVVVQGLDGQTLGQRRKYVVEFGQHAVIGTRSEGRDKRMVAIHFIADAITILHAAPHRPDTLEGPYAAPILVGLEARAHHRWDQARQAIAYDRWRRGR